MNKKHLLKWKCLLCFLFYLFDLQAQIPSAPANIQSPNVASLGQFGTFPVSYYTGLASIAVPLYTLQQKSISVPITMNYHASGVRPDMHPGWVGMGFSLSSGGVISRIVKDMPDDYSNSNYFQGGNNGFYYNRNVLNTPTWNQIPYMRSIARNDEMLKDTEPDEFSFSFGGYSGSFYLHANGTWKVKCDKPLTISMISEMPFIDVPFTAPSGTRMAAYGTSKSFSGFIITTEDGTKYQFGGNTNAIEYSIDFFNQGVNEWCAGSWYLTRIIATNQEVIDFNYERDDFINQMYIGIVNDLGTRTKNSSGLFNPQPACNSWSYSTAYHSYNGQLIAPVYLKQISSSHANIIFERSTSTELRYSNTIYDYQHSEWSQHGGGNFDTYFLPILTGNGMDVYPDCLNMLQWKKLDRILVQKKDGSVLKAFEFNYNNNLNQRLTLQSIEELDKDLNGHSHYSFSYIEGGLPGYLSNMVDHWGFYNGINADMSNQDNYYTTYYNYRDPVAAYLYAGTLNRITYPTGGITEFTYEPHSYSKRIQEERGNGIDNLFNNNTLAGGLRISKIASYDSRSQSPKQEKQYFYVNNYSNTVNLSSLKSSGVLGGQSKYYFSDYSRVAFNDNGITYSKSLFSSLSVLPGSINAMGNHIGYSQVVEKLSDGSYTIYSFSNFDTGAGDAAADNMLQLSRTPYEPYNSHEQERGNLINEVNYSATNKIIRSRHLGYVSLNKSNEYVPSLKANFSNVCSGTAVSVEEGTAYRLYTYSVLPSWEIINEYDNFQVPTTSLSKSYNYDSQYKQLVDETVIDSRNLEVKTAYVYPFNFLSALGTDIRRQMAEKHILSPVVEQRTYVDNVQRSGTYTDYELIASPANFVPSTVKTQTTSSSVLTTKALIEYNDNGDVVWARKNDSDAGTCYLWGYGGQFLIAKIDNTDYARVTAILGGIAAVNDFRNTIDPDSAQVTSFLAPLYIMENTLITTYTYEPLVGLTSQTDSKGQTTYYEYDSFQRLSAVRDQDGKLIKSYCYNYAGQEIDCFGNAVGVFISDEQTGQFARIDCFEGYTTGEAVTYTVPYGKYSSTISKADANQQAAADLAANGPIYASTTGVCIKIVYVTFEPIIKNAVLLDGSEEGDETLYEYRGDLIVRFYNDPQKALPIDVTDKELALMLQLDPRAGFFPPGHPNTLTIMGEGTAQVLFEDVPIQEEFAQRNQTTGEFQVINVMNYSYGLAYHPRYVVVN